VDQELVADALRGDHETLGAVRSQADDLTNDSVARDFDGRETALGRQAGSERARPGEREVSAGGQRPAKKVTTICFSRHQ
jgi:hypothetical protein